MVQTTGIASPPCRASRGAAGCSEADTSRSADEEPLYPPKAMSIVMSEGDSMKVKLNKAVDDAREAAHEVVDDVKVETHKVVTDTKIAVHEADADAQIKAKDAEARRKLGE